jgi:N-methylhydantoinase A/oxoprolinase/acetone carboxylase beta subunit
VTTAEGGDGGAPASWLVGVDIGGTFTDLVAVDAYTGRQVTAKVPTTPEDPGQGILDALEVAERQVGLKLDSAAAFVHATTLAINTVIERNGATIALIATDGFTDVLEMGYANRHDMYDLQIQKQPALVDRQLCFGLAERSNSAGEVVASVDPASLERAMERLEQENVRSVAVCLLHAYKNPENERAVRAALVSRNDELAVSLSSDVAPVIREYERSLTTAVNAYVSPKLSTYLGRLTQTVEQAGFVGGVHIMRSDGGWFSAPEASETPVRILESGPAAGAIAGADVVSRCDLGLSVAFDMGGTTAKACLIVDGEPSITEELEVSRLDRARRGSGLPIRLPSVDLIEIGAGGGSVAAIGPLGLLQVGPESSGAVPGPACYGKGGRRPTVTDADLVLGYLDPANFAGGAMALDVDAARSAIDRDLVDPGGADDTVLAAWGIHHLVNENMALAMRMHCVERGVDPAGISIVATGGAGPVHASGIMDSIGARSVVCPLNVGVASAFGLLLAPRTAERTVTDMILLSKLTSRQLEERLRAIVEDIGGRTERADDLDVRRAVRARLQGQGYELNVPLPDHVTSIDTVAAEFRAQYERRFGRPPPDRGQIEIVDWTVRIIEHRQALPQPEEPMNRDPDAALGPRSRHAYWGPGAGWLETAVFERRAIGDGQSIVGPAVAEEPTSTIVVRPGQLASADHAGNIVIVNIGAEAR